MKKYIDCDGVILDTETGLFDRYDELKKVNPNLKRTYYLQEMDWVYWLKQADILNDSIQILKNYDPKNIDILTKVHSLQEGVAKLEYFRKLEVKNNVIIVPNKVNKSDIVIAEGNILVDDSIKNLEDWDKNNGYAFYFGEQDCSYSKVNSLEEVLNPKILEKKLNH